MSVHVESECGDPVRGAEAGQRTGHQGRYCSGGPRRRLFGGGRSRCDYWLLQERRAREAVAGEARLPDGAVAWGAAAAAAAGGERREGGYSSGRSVPRGGPGGSRETRQGAIGRFALRDFAQA